jgi:hypothetical protein
MRVVMGGVVLLAFVGCRRGQSVAPPPPAKVEAPEPAAIPLPAPAPAPAPAPSVADEELVEEAPEANPRSETVTIKLVAEPSRKARVFWGRKDLGLAPLELQRPRNSGPLDLLVVAPGALPLHTRVFTDRDDKIALRLVAESDAPSLLGYRPEPPPPDKPARSDGGRQRQPWPSR